MKKSIQFFLLCFLAYAVASYCTAFVVGMAYRWEHLGEPASVTVARMSKDTSFAFRMMSSHTIVSATLGLIFGLCAPDLPFLRLMAVAITIVIAGAISPLAFDILMPSSGNGGLQAGCFASVFIRMWRERKARGADVAT